MNIGRKIRVIDSWYGTYDRKKVQLADLRSGNWDFFISVYNSSERVNWVFEAVNASNKFWIVQHQYGFHDDELPSEGYLVNCDSDGEAENALKIWEAMVGEGVDAAMKVCVDITGFMRAELAAFVRVLVSQGVMKVDMLYSEPLAYVGGQETEFSMGSVREVRQINGFEGHHTGDADSRELLVIGAGYDVNLIKAISESRRFAKKMLVVGLPPLRLEMYQESRLQIASAAEWLGGIRNSDYIYAPAGDPFSTAEVLHDALRIRSAQFDDFYLCPIGPKAQVLGFSLYYMFECLGKPTSLIFPFASNYSKETSRGLASVWWYRVELDRIHRYLLNLGE